MHYQVYTHMINNYEEIVLFKHPSLPKSLPLLYQWEVEAWLNIVTEGGIIILTTTNSTE